jgi:hypothetical protein
MVVSTCTKRHQWSQPSRNIVPAFFLPVSIPSAGEHRLNMVRSTMPGVPLYSALLISVAN